MRNGKFGPVVAGKRIDSMPSPLLENLEQRLLLTTVSLALSTTEIAESSGVPAVFTVSRDNTVGDLTVKYRVGGSEPAGHIAETLSGTLVIPAGFSSANISATPVDDSAAGYNNTLTVALLAPDGAGYSLGTVSQGTVRIDESDSLLGTYLTVGPGKMYADPWAALYTLAANNVIIDVWPSASGQYTMNNAAGDTRFGKVYYDNITIRGIGEGRVKTFSDPATNIANDEGIFLLKSGHTGLTLENLDIEGARGLSRNDAALRAESGDFTVRNCMIANSQDGILGGTAGVSNILIEYSEFYHNGLGTGSMAGYTHNLYLAGNTLTFQYNYSHDSATGHLLKTRCRTNYILYNRFQGEAVESYEINVPDAGKTYIIGNIVHQSPNTSNGGIIDYASESAPQAGDYLYIVGNTVVNDRTNGGTFVQGLLVPSGFNVTIEDNIFAGPGTPWNLANGVIPTTAGNVINSNIAALNFVNAAGFDYHLLSTSPAIGAAVYVTTSSDGYPLTPTQEYVRENGVKPRFTGVPLDAGAYDYPLVGGDANRDGNVDVVDLGILARNYDTLTGATWATGDFNGDGAVNVIDLGILARNYDYVAPAGNAPAAAPVTSGGVSALAAPTKSAVLLAAAPVLATTATVQANASSAALDVPSVLDDVSPLGTLKGKKLVQVRRLKSGAAWAHKRDAAPVTTSIL